MPSERLFASSNELPARLLLRIFIPFACGYFLSYLFRVVNTVIASDLSADLGIDAEQLGLLSSIYFIAFASTQLPLGIWLDRFGPRRTEAFLLVFAAVGAAVFAMAEGMSGVIFGRALIGIGVSACLMAGFKAFVQWFPLEKLPLMNGILLAAGGLGVLSASTPVEFALKFTDWRGVFIIISVFTFMVAVMVFVLVPDKEETPATTSTREYIQGVKFIFTDRRFWEIAPWSVATQGAMLSTISLWSGPWLRDVAGFERGAIAHVLFLIGIGLVLGYSLLGLITERMNRRGFTTEQISATGMVIYMFLQIAIIFELVSVAYWIWALLAFFGTSGVLIYAGLSQRFPNELAGRVNTALNLLVFVLAFFAQWGIGWIINYYSGSDVTQYAAKGYKVAFTCLLGLQVVAMGGYYWARFKQD
jgi:predicted MFS family arabinose efflux permease